LNAAQRNSNTNASRKPNQVGGATAASTGAGAASSGSSSIDPKKGGRKPNEEGRRAEKATNADKEKIKRSTMVP
jgi:hypothetical protein